MAQVQILLGENAIFSSYSTLFNGSRIGCVCPTSLLTCTLKISFSGSKLEKCASGDLCIVPNYCVRTA